jgi:hypothetical protein
MLHCNRCLPSCSETADRACPPGAPATQQWSADVEQPSMHGPPLFLPRRSLVAVGHADSGAGPCKRIRRSAISSVYRPTATADLECISAAMPPILLAWRHPHTRREAPPHDGCQNHVPTLQRPYPRPTWTLLLRHMQGYPASDGKPIHHAVGRIDASQAAMRVGGCHSALGRRCRGVDALTEQAESAVSECTDAQQRGPHARCH